MPYLAKITLIGLMLASGAQASPARAQSAAARRPTRVDALLARGQRFLAAGDGASAIGYFREAIDVDPSDERAYGWLGRAYRERGAWADARDVFEAGLVRHPGSDRLWMGLARTLIAAEQRERAEAALRTLLRYRPRHLDALALRSRLARERGAWGEALAVIRAWLTEANARGLSEEETRDARGYEAALRLMAGPLDPVSARRACRSSRIRRTLAGCEPAPR